MWKQKVLFINTIYTNNEYVLYKVKRNQFLCLFAWFAFKELIHVYIIWNLQNIDIFTTLNADPTW